MSDSNENNLHPIAWLLLRDLHAVPVYGLEPTEIKRSSKHTILATELQHRKRLTAIVDTLGFKGDFGDYERREWPRLGEFLRDHGCSSQRDLFADAHGNVIFGLARLFGPNRRQLADRIHLGPSPAPQRVFLGWGVDWAAWDQRAVEVRARPYQPWTDRRFVPQERETTIRWLLERRIELDGQWGFLDDKLVAGPVECIVDKSYYDDPVRAAALRDEDRERLASAVAAFRAVFDEQAEGWVDVLRYNDALTILRGHDCAWDVLWRDLRETAPPREAEDVARYDLHVADRPLALLGEHDLARRLYFRRGAWDEREAHLAEQQFYDRGRDRFARRQTSTDEVRRLYLVENGVWPVEAREAWTAPPPAGFRRVEVGARALLVGDLVTVGEFQRMFAATNYLERRDANEESWARANEGVPPEAPAGVTWNDAQAYCAWVERTLGVRVRLPTKAELRALRPFFSQRYERMAGGDFFWEKFPPRPLEQQEAGGEVRRVELPSAVAWSEPRFLPVGPEQPEFPADSGVATTSRKRWISDFPPRGPWAADLPWAEHAGLQFIDAWDAYEWCQEPAWVSGRFWEGMIGVRSWGAYKNVKIAVRLVLDVDVP